ncbi:molybdopterin synthase catalytic subunit MoaE [Echinimonas agarilytica]|uniref:Molybdopterin synthase catalytic subunit n=1 Tax=Echinimonas agarilytica TaxID=1215918 RepID=A0AA42B8P5_9GAMM|nr:molybdopterin synthase catalytic subunit MoaE [Echinimonas agarilytica]MCM2681204.1 molybdopterin synthase catalytic subunit MoaE [Echinimonas agarilytica]
MNVKIDVAECWIDVLEAQQWLSGDTASGAIVTFIGQVRNHNLDDTVTALTLEHYPAMTQRTLSDIADQANERWTLGRIYIYHRVGRLEPGEPIVFVGVSSAHRDASFEAARFIMDILKTSAPFWKKEQTAHGERWLDARASDERAAHAWSD